MNVYSPNNDNEAVQFYDHLIDVSRKESLAYEDKIIIGGDFNCPINPLLDKKGGILVLRKKVVDRIEEIQTTFNLHDVRRVKNPQAKSFTWSQKSPFLFCRLDYWLISNSLLDLIKDVNIIAAIRSDHSAILLHLQEIEECQRGVRQGDPLSPYLFLIAIEIMAISIRTDENIEGIKIGEDETRSLFYADDVTATLANISSVEKVIQILNDFEKCSGLKMNLSKTKAMWVGKKQTFFRNTSGP